MSAPLPPPPGSRIIGTAIPMALVALALPQGLRTG